MKAKPSEKPQPEYIEGSEAFQRFDAMMTALIAVPHSVIERREKAYRKKVASNPNRRGPKSKGAQVRNLAARPRLKPRIPSSPLLSTMLQCPTTTFSAFPSKWQPWFQTQEKPYGRNWNAANSQSWPLIGRLSQNRIQTCKQSEDGSCFTAYVRSLFSRSGC